jgi:hypothetical protein
MMDLRHLNFGLDLTFELCHLTFNRDLFEIPRLSDIIGAKHEDTGDRRMWVHWK